MSRHTRLGSIHHFIFDETLDIFINEICDECDKIFVYRGVKMSNEAAELIERSVLIRQRWSV